MDEHTHPEIAEVVTLESRFPAALPAQLQQLGHHVRIQGEFEDSMGHAQAILIDPVEKVFAGAADPRCDGLALGY
jgi:gamma-glutamyltranspeptidase/glutathione hydrolase